MRPPLPEPAVRLRTHPAQPSHVGVISPRTDTFQLLENRSLAKNALNCHNYACRSCAAITTARAKYGQLFPPLIFKSPEVAAFTCGQPARSPRILFPPWMSRPRSASLHPQGASGFEYAEQRKSRQLVMCCFFTSRIVLVSKQEARHSYDQP